MMYRTLPLPVLAAVLVAPAQAASAQEQAPRYLPTLAPAEAPQAAAECLALAIAYEAGQEPIAGQEAVAQVIHNRVRHSGYPDSVCGVVWQGSERRTGCQFTFTCDGSLRRPRTPAQIASARAVAARVMAGESTDHVRGATHYHADYVSPYWAPSLARVGQIATHIFYRSPGRASVAEGTPARIALTARRVAPVSSSGVPAAPSPDPAVRNGEFAPWGLSLGPARRP
ncbi:MAG: cell wall hydrolase [Porphyrobacter sp.]|nr:cell wall hydrolase [Porphyrobacter sp.]